MINVALPTGYIGTKNIPKARESLINLFNMDGTLMRTPGISLLDDSYANIGPCRGGLYWSTTGRAYFVIGTQLYISNEDLSGISPAPVTEPIGFVDRRVTMFAGQTYMIIMVEGASTYTVDEDGNVAPITSINFKTPVSGDFIDGRYVFVPADGSPVIYSDIDSPNSYDPLSFFDAEELPDTNKHVINVRNMLFIMGEESTEVFTSTGNASAPFARRTGSRIDYGYTSGALRYQNTFCFIGQQRGQAPTFYILGTGDCTEIANSAVVEDLSKYTLEELREVRTARFNWLGREFLSWSFHDKTFAFCDGNWIILDSEVNGRAGGPWRANTVVYVGDKYFVGDIEDGRIGYLDDVPSEYGQQIEYQFDTYARPQRGTFMVPSTLELDCLTGQNATTIGLSLSRDGRIKGDYHYRGLGSTGQYQRRVTWRPSGGLGRFESFMGISVRGTGKVQFSAEALNVS